jgi:opacity protein-like surface antigen
LCVSGVTMISIFARALGATVAIAALSLATGVSAQSPALNGFYVGFGAGADFPADLGYSVHVPRFPNISVTGHVNLDTSASGSATFGYRFNDYFATEGELGYADFGISSIGIKVTAFRRSNSGAVDVNGNIQTFTGFANLMVTPFGHHRVTPYIGGGIGFGNTDAQVKSVSLNGLGMVPIGQSGSQTDFAAQAILGLDLAVTSRFDIGARYKLFWIDNGQSGIEKVACGCITAKGQIDDFMAQSVMATATLHW